VEPPWIQKLSDLKGVVSTWVTGLLSCIAPPAVLATAMDFVPVFTGAVLLKLTDALIGLLCQLFCVLSP
jgi:hypothetical protein